MSDRIFREPVIGFVIIKGEYQFSNRKGKPEYYITQKIITTNWEGLDGDDIDLYPEEREVVGVIPAPPGSFAVYGCLPDDTATLLGYEFPGAYSPDWEELLDTVIKQRTRDSGKEKGK